MTYEAIQNIKEDIKICFLKGKDWRVRKFRGFKGHWREKWGEHVGSFYTGMQESLRGCYSHLVSSILSLVVWWGSWSVLAL